MPIIDSHVHLWDPGQMRIPWLDGIPALNRPYGMAEYAASADDVEAIVYVQVDVAPAYGLVEAQLVADMARRDPRIQAIVAYAPLEDGPQARSYLDALTQISPLITGVRRLTQGESDPAFCLRPGFEAGVRILASYGLSCDLCITHRQLPATAELVRRCPEVSFILDHLGKPAARAGELEPWRAQIAELAALPNVMCKLSGLVTEADHQRWTVDDLAPYVAHALEVFGEDRVAFGSDWPVVLLAADQRRWAAALGALTAHLSPEARQKLWSENASS
ncbi:amidohydrolase family protein [Oscillochloris sp. ZM17-4]|uniref:amidohydrolase family protein n=1 Tax=Oscillochloris sp. ZM17-4 TaxID=2866714 RepID=UPI001C734AB5|nr:amidohydrolase family protein [Oscillochloris sp. ZM17-4]MBX0326313.1 amidohydrolase family protein [Oscillochloris sp. ZM17-4]